MPINNLFHEYSLIIAKAADVCMKPWHHAVVDTSINNTESFEILVRVECRSAEGTRHPENDLDLEIYNSGNEVNLIISWNTKPESPYLWQGKHSVWLDSVDGTKCSTPNDGEKLESFGRRLRALFSSYK